MVRNASLLILYDKNLRVLLQYRTADARLLANHWAFFGGGIKKDETPKEALLREIYEELNYIPKSPKLILRKNFKEAKFRGVLYIYIEEFKEKKQSLVLKEGERFGWFNKDEISNLKMTKRDKDIIHFVYRYLEKNGRYI